MTAETIASIARDVFGVQVSDGWAESVAKGIAWRSTQLPSPPSSGYKSNWIHLALCESGAFVAGCRSDDFGEVATARMHCFFVHIEETAEQIARLTGEKKSVARHAKSKIATTPLKAKPIDRLAWIVAPTDAK